MCIYNKYIYIYIYVYVYPGCLKYNLLTISFVLYTSMELHQIM